MRYLVVFSGIVMSVFFLTCRESSEPQISDSRSKVFNPNGDSELALLMRDMFDDLMRIKSDAAVGKHSEVRFDPAAIFTAHATEPAKAASETYRQLGQAYLIAQRAFENAESTEKKAHFTGLVQSCVTCHQQLCPGPIRKIDRLFYKDDL